MITDVHDLSTKYVVIFYIQAKALSQYVKSGEGDLNPINPNLATPLIS
jgi:hypothetical protein